MSNFYRFPAMVKPDGWTVSDQLSKIEEETREAIKACGDYGCTQLDTGYASAESENARIKYLMKVLKIIQATETLLRMEATDEEVEQLQQAVIEKNRKRGYYGE